MALRATRSPNRTEEARATRIGDAVTRTTLAAIVVYESEAIQVAKWTASRPPEAVRIRRCRPMRARSSGRRRATASGTTRAAAKAFR